MKKLFSNVQTLKSSEDCKKYSKSVSYKTLAGGTAICTGYKQIQRLSECCANYRFCKTMRFLCENLVDGLLQTLSVFRFVKILILVVFLSAVIISESQAENTEEVTIVHSGNCGIDGADNCQWSLDSKGKLTVTGSGATDNYSYTPYYNSPWSDYRNDIFSVDISGISTIGQGAFGHLPNLKDVYMDDSVTVLGTDAFWESPMENIRISDSLTAMYTGALFGNHLTSLTILDTLKNISSTHVFGKEPDRLENLDLICKGENCETIKMKLMNYTLWYEEKWYTKDISDILRTAQSEEECDSAKYYYNGRSCIKVPADGSRPCADNFKRNEKYCNRIFYTPAEAAKVLRDGDDNEITITFKK